ncbi:unnamed protein product [Oikopleura dioica]|uniref:G protein gamma domain-containing protein n=1 Tax=Oikopleura dioica TaxID=34765 RepID=E4XXY5_OIKDI|nr:unnamed protein product [Oikopleura dioica]
MDHDKQMKQQESKEFLLLEEQFDGPVCLREPVVKTMLDPRFEQADRRIRAKMLFEKTTLIRPDGRCFEELKKEVMDEGRQIIESGTNLLNMKRLKISESVGQIMDFCLNNQTEDPLITRSRTTSNPVF